MKKKLCIVTGSRAEYGSYYPLLDAIRRDGTLALQIVVTGMHLSRKYGLTYREIEKDGYHVTEKVPVLLFGDSEKGVTKSIGLGIKRFADTFARLRPDMVLLIGDRFETFSAAVAAFTANIPIAHIGGGDITRGVMDDAFRHSITKMSYLHFATVEEHRERIVRLGEDPRRVFTVGAPGIDNIKQLKLLSKADIENELSVKLGRMNMLVTFHPVTLEKNTSARHFKEVLKALDRFHGALIIFTKPNADASGGSIIKMIDEYVERHPDKAVAFTSLGQVRYLSLLKYIDVAVGNSSSGIVEVPLFCKPTVNIGDRQDGRVKGGSVIDCTADAKSIYRAIRRALSEEFRKKAPYASSPYGKGNAAAAIIKVIKERIRGKIDLKKKFYEFPTGKNRYLRRR